MAARLAEKRRQAMARVGSLVFDSLLIAYVVWGLSFLESHWTQATFLQRHPALLGVSPILAVLWQMTGASLGQRGYRLQMSDLDGAPPHWDRRLAWALAAAAPLVVCLFLFSLLEGLWLPLGLSAALALLCLLSALFRPDGRALPERFAGVRLATRRGEDSTVPAPWWARSDVWAILGGLALTFAVGSELTRVSLSALIDNVGRTKPIVSRLTSPDWSIAHDVIDKLVETVFLALMASALSLPFAFLLSFFGARNLTRGTLAGRVSYTLARIFMNVTRSIEPLIWGIIFIVWVGVGPFAGMLALFIHSVAALGKLYSEAIESIDPGPVEAIQATGASTLQVLRYGVVPQVIPPFLSFTVYRWDINVRMATILGLIGGGGIGTLLVDYTQLGAWNKLGTVIVFITLVVWLMDIASAKARERLG